MSRQVNFLTTPTYFDYLPYMSRRRWDLGFGRSRRRDLVRHELVKRVQMRKCRVMWACQRINWCSQCKQRKRRRNFYKWWHLENTGCKRRPGWPGCQGRPNRFQPRPDRTGGGGLTFHTCECGPYEATYYEYPTIHQMSHQMPEFPKGTIFESCFRV